MEANQKTKSMLIMGIVLLVLGLLPILLPTTYFRISPLAAPVRQHQRSAISSRSCEVCGAPATKRTIKPYKAEMTTSGQYVGYNPREWPGNSEILLCEKHLGYSDAAVAKRLSYSALLYLLFMGNNMWLRLVFLIHLAVLAAGCYVVFKWKAQRNT